MPKWKKFLRAKRNAFYYYYCYLLWWLFNHSLPKQSAPTDCVEMVAGDGAVIQEALEPLADSYWCTNTTRTAQTDMAIGYSHTDDTMTTQQLTTNGEVLMAHIHHRSRQHHHHKITHTNEETQTKTTKAKFAAKTNKDEARNTRSASPSHPWRHTSRNAQGNDIERRKSNIIQKLSEKKERKSNCLKF